MAKTIQHENVVNYHEHFVAPSQKEWVRRIDRTNKFE